MSPLSWIFLFLFGVMVLMMTVLIWWIKKIEFDLNIKDGDWEWES